MQADSRKPSLLHALFANKCPNCRKGDVFVHKSIFPLRTFLSLVDKCPVCGQKMKSESNNGAGINYALTVMVILLNALWYWPIFGISYMDNSIFYFMTVSIGIAVLLQPWLMRLSRMLYLYLYISYGSGTTVQS